MKPLLLALLTSAVPAAALDLPSGQTASLHEVLIDAVGNEAWVRFRMIAPEITREVDYAQTADDMLHLCDTLALPYLGEYALTADVVVISLADRATEFGVADPEAVQVFEAFRVQDNACIWEGL